VRFAFLLVVIGCGSRTALIAPDEPDDEEAGVDGSIRRRDAGKDAVVIDVVDEPVFNPMCIADAGPPGASACKATLHVMAIQKSMLSCFVDVVVMEGDTAALTYDCTPSGNARVIANGKTFIGTYDGKTLDVCTGTTFPWNDGCQWESAQHFRGDPNSGFLTFTYSEMPYQGTACQPPCQASAVVKVGP
jgi:hypothetical protein